MNLVLVVPWSIAAQDKVAFQFASFGMRDRKLSVILDRLKREIH
jgi:hypothetical protein